MRKNPLDSGDGNLQNVCGPARHVFAAISVLSYLLSAQQNNPKSSVALVSDTGTSPWCSSYIINAKGLFPGKADSWRVVGRSFACVAYLGKRLPETGGE